MPKLCQFFAQKGLFFSFLFFLCVGGRGGGCDCTPAPNSCTNVRRVLWIWVCTSVRTCCLAGSFLRIETLVFFLKISMLLGVHMTLRVNEPKFSGKISFRLIIAKNDPKMGFWGFFVESYHLICLILV